MSDLKLTIEQTEKTENGLDVLLRDKNGKWVGWFYDFETAKQVSESLDEIQAIQTRLADVEAENARLKSLLDKNMASISANNLKQAFANETTKEVSDE